MDRVETDPPHDLTAEQCVIGSLLMATGAKMSDAIDRVAENLDRSDFYSDRNRAIFAAVVKLRRSGVDGIDVVTVGDDPDGDTLVYSLLKPENGEIPEGMEIDPVTGIVSWTPGINDEGPYEMHVLVVDAYGEGEVQKVALTVRGTNLPPAVDPNGPMWVEVGKPYEYPIHASDPDGHKLTYELLTPVGDLPGTVDLASGSFAETGLFQWTPIAEGDYPVQFRVTDELGASVTFEITVRVAAQVTPNLHWPEITSSPHDKTGVGDDWSYRITATDADGDELTFQLVDKPSNAIWDADANDELPDGTPDEDISPESALFTWTPTADQEGGPHYFEVLVSDGARTVKHWFWVYVGPANQPPVISEIGDQTVTGGLAIEPIFAGATDPNAGDELTHWLDQASLDRGMTIDARTGVIQWQETPVVTSDTDYEVTVYVTDHRADQPDEETFTITVKPDTTDPTVEIEFDDADFDSSEGPYGDVLRIHVIPDDDIGFVSRALTLLDPNGGGNDQQLDLVDGWASLTLTEAHVGPLTFVATATDAAGNAGQSEETIYTVIDPNAGGPPSADLVPPNNGDPITAPIDIVGSASDPEGDYANFTWTLTAINLETDERTELSSDGGAPIDNGVLGQFDPTLLRNGFYRIELEVSDGGEIPATDSVVVEVASANKLGNFTMSFTDLEIPLFPDYSSPGNKTSLKGIVSVSTLQVTIRQEAHDEFTGCLVRVLGISSRKTAGRRKFRRPALQRRGLARGAGVRRTNRSLRAIRRRAER